MDFSAADSLCKQRAEATARDTDRLPQHVTGRREFPVCRFITLRPPPPLRPHAPVPRLSSSRLSPCMLTMTQVKKIYIYSLFSYVNRNPANLLKLLHCPRLAPVSLNPSARRPSGGRTIRSDPKSPTVGALYGLPITPPPLTRPLAGSSCFLRPRPGISPPMSPSRPPGRCASGPPPSPPSARSGREAKHLFGALLGRGCR